MSLLAPDIELFADRIGLARESEILRVALTHSSYAAEHHCESNERLEFLGDAVVDLAITDLIVREYPHLNEGSGSLVRSRVVSEAPLARAAQALGLGDVLRVGRGVVKENGRERPSILADAFEAVAAAVYLECGSDAARSFVQSQLADELANASLEPAEADPKTRLRQWSEAAGFGIPSYDVVATGPSHDVEFVATVRVNADLVATGTGRSKKAAEAQAAQAAWEGHISA